LSSHVIPGLTGFPKIREVYMSAIKKMLPLIVLLFGLAAAPLAGASDAPVTNVSADDIRADAHVIAGAGLVSSGQPDKDVLATARDAGFTTVIDLRRESEDRGMDEPAVAEALGMKYISLPVDGAAGVTFENAAALDKYLSEADGPVFLHCRSGNRVGALFALRAAMAGATEEEAIAEGKAAGLTSLETAVREQLDKAE